ncbi:MAG: hypothetical protein ACJAUP_002750 [Cellvibrionaceae bacterium]|jgi:uncharacterized protein YgiM (DUF1202 family)
MLLFSTNTRDGSQPLWPIVTLCFACLAFSANSLAKKEALQVITNDTYINMRTGPGRGYPVFHVLEKGEAITLLYSKTDWIKALSTKGIEGWIHKRFMDNTIGLNGETVELGIPRRDELSRRNWEFGTTAGAFDNSIEVIGLHGAYRFTKNISAELRFSQATGRFSNSQFYSWGLVHQPFPEWRLSPFITLANGQIEFSPNTNSTQESTKDNFFMVGVGLNYHLNHRFIARFEYNNHTTLPDSDKNGNIDEWRLGITAVF